MKHIFFCISLTLSWLPALIKAQDTASYRDDEVFKKQVYAQVKIDMEQGLIKGFRQLRAETDLAQPSQPVKVHYRTAAATKELSPDAVFKQLEKSVFVVWKFYKRTTSNIEGITVHATAFAIDDKGTMVSNQHVISQLIDKKQEVYDMDSTLFLTDAWGNVFGIDSVLSYNENADISFFTVKNIHKATIHSLPLGKDPLVGSATYVLSHPEGFPYYFSSGIVARTSRYSEFGEYTERLNITADYGKGSSGAPVVNQYGALIGLVSSTHSIYARNMDNLQMVVKQVVPLRSIKAFLQYL